MYILFIDGGMPETPIFIMDSPVDIDRFDHENIRMLFDRETIKMYMGQKDISDSNMGSKDMDNNNMGRKDDNDNGMDGKNMEGYAGGDGMYPSGEGMYPGGEGMNPGGRGMYPGDEGMMGGMEPKFTYSVTDSAISMTDAEGRTSELMKLNDVQYFKLDPVRRIVYYFSGGDLFSKQWTDQGVTKTKLADNVGDISGFSYDPATRRIYFSDSSAGNIQVYDVESQTTSTLAEGVDSTEGTLSFNPDGTLIWMQGQEETAGLVRYVIRTGNKMRVGNYPDFTGSEENLMNLASGQGRFVFFMRNGELIKYNTATMDSKVVESGNVRAISRGPPGIGGIFYITEENKVNILICNSDCF